MQQWLQHFNNLTLLNLTKSKFQRSITIVPRPGPFLQKIWIKKKIYLMSINALVLRFRYDEND